ncbi:serine hydrolase domain-containing protein [Planctobacterium marinum]|uniref:Beta-lactamase-related domain-containing protein n=1 Tax=Planctobacterium marinum TaxID=1631968 RepID=A0AA48HKW3_9ALTE|nr:hypothetical protein MACH26_38220 [Planctobacterium marinum]
MNIKFPFKSLIGLAFIGSVSTYTSANNNAFLQHAPKATKQEALIKHWRQPELELRFMDIAELEKPYISFAPVDQKDSIRVAKNTTKVDKTALSELAGEIATGEHGKLDSLLISHRGRLLFESYYRRGRIDLSHPQSSATKSYTSLAVGRAIQMGYLTMADLHKPVISFLTHLNPQKLVAGAERITLHHALTMTTGIDISEEQWKAINEKPQQLKGQNEIQIILETSKAITQQTQVFKYGTGPQFIMQVLDTVVPGSAKDFIQKELLDKLGISNYHWKTAPSGLPESGWKTSFTSRDMLKFGMLAINNGKWQGEQLISEEYLNKATSRLVYTGDGDIYGGGENVSNQGYGYYFWGTDLSVGDRKYSSASAQGGGGMYILLVKELDLVVVVTAHHRNDSTQQLVAEHIIPLLIQ